MRNQLNFQAEPFLYPQPLAEGETGVSSRSYAYRSRYVKGSGSKSRGKTSGSRTSSRSASSSTSSSGSGYGSASRSPWRRSRYGSSSSSSTRWTVWAQRCLRKAVGSWVPMTGKLGSSTRRALRIFQSREGLPITGMLDSATASALRSACSAGGYSTYAAPYVPAEPSYSEPEPAGEPMEPSSSGDGQGSASAEPPPDDAPPTEGDEAELASQGDLEREFLVDGPCKVKVEAGNEQVQLTHGNVARIPSGPGVYVIYLNEQPWYVGVAESSLKKRFQSRMKALKDLGIPDSVLANCKVSWMTLKSDDPGCPIGRREKGSNEPYHRAKGPHQGLLKVLEMHYIKANKTFGRGNKRWEAVNFGRNGSLVVNNGAPRTGNDLALPR